jgi:Spy/CpxP family protein refolding chaperone
MNKFRKGSIVAIAAVAALTMGLSSYAQQAPGGAPGGGGGGGFRQGRQGGRGGFGQPTLTSVPAAVLADGLKLTAVQKAKIQAIQDQARKDTQALRPAQGQQPDFQEMRQKMQALNEETNKSIEGVLTPDQLKAAPAFLKSVGGYRTVGIPLEVLPDLKLTADQKTKIAAIADAAQKQLQDEMQKMRAAGGGQPGGGGGGGGFQAIQDLMKANGDKAAAVLTSGQKAILDKYKADHPQRGFGGPGGGGGGRRGGGGAPGGNGPAL